MFCDFLSLKNYVNVQYGTFKEEHAYKLKEDIMICWSLEGH
jgi:hypothetical protein